MSSNTKSLFLVSGMCKHETVFSLFVAESEEESKQMFVGKYSDYWFAYVNAREVKEVDGYGVVLWNMANS